MSLLYATSSAPLRSIVLTAADRARLAAQGLLVLPPPAAVLPKPRGGRPPAWCSMSIEERLALRAKLERVVHAWFYEERRAWGSLTRLCRLHGVEDSSVVQCAQRLGLLAKSPSRLSPRSRVSPRVRLSRISRISRQSRKLAAS